MSNINKPDIKPIPVSKKCKVCRKDQLLCEYDFSNNKKNKRLAICKSCIGIEQEADDAPNGGCCQECFMEMATYNSFDQLDSLLNIIEAAQYNDVEIPSDLLHRMLEIVLDSGHFDIKVKDEKG